MKREDIPKMKTLFFSSSKKGQWFACMKWLEALKKLPLHELHRPNEVSAPWHWVAQFQGGDGYAVRINMWPHLEKWQVETDKSETGWDLMIDRVFLLMEEEQS